MTMQTMEQEIKALKGKLERIKEIVKKDPRNYEEAQFFLDDIEEIVEEAARETPKTLEKELHQFLVDEEYIKRSATIVIQSHEGNIVTFLINPYKRLYLATYLEGKGFQNLSIRVL